MSGERGDRTAKMHRETERWHRNIGNNPYSTSGSGGFRESRTKQKPREVLGIEPQEKAAY
jgi:hypothetical protein